MKKIFWTSVVWIVILVLFGLYTKLLNDNLANNIAGFFSTEKATSTVEISESKDMATVSEQLTTMQNKLENILQTLGGTTAMTGDTAIVITGEPTK